jgi:hypothetical protein
LVALSAEAQQLPEQPRREEREIVLTGAPDERPVVYGAADVPLVLQFDAPLQEDAGVILPGADVRAHPHLENSLVLTASKPLATQGAVPLSVPLADGGVALNLVFTPEKSDRGVRIVRRAVSTGEAIPRSQEAVHEVLGVAARAVLGEASTCHSLDSRDPQPRTIVQSKEVSFFVLVCAVGSFSYIRAKAPISPGCAPTAARVVGGNEIVEALFFEPAMSCEDGLACQTLIIQTPTEEADGFVLELLARDNAICQSIEGVALRSGVP